MCVVSMYVIYVCVSLFSNISSETTGPIEAKFLHESLFKWSRSHDDMATMPIYGENL